MHRKLKTHNLETGDYCIYSGIGESDIPLLSGCDTSIHAVKKIEEAIRQAEKLGYLRGVEKSQTAIAELLNLGHPRYGWGVHL